MRKNSTAFIHKGLIVYVIDSNFGTQSTPIPLETEIKPDSLMQVIGSSQFVQLYAADTYRTMMKRPLPEDRVPLDNRFKTVTYDIFSAEGNFILQIAIVVSVDARPGITVNSSELTAFIAKLFTKMADIIAAKQELSLKKLPDLVKSILPTYAKDLNLTVVINAINSEAATPVQILNTEIYFSPIGPGDDGYQPQVWPKLDFYYLVTPNGIFRIEKVLPAKGVVGESKLVPKPVFTGSTLALSEKLFENMSDEQLESILKGKKRPEKTEDLLKLITGTIKIPNNAQNLRQVHGFTQQKVAAYTTQSGNIGNHVVHMRKTLPDSIYFSTLDKDAEGFSFKQNASSCYVITPREIYIAIPGQPLKLVKENSRQFMERFQATLPKRLEEDGYVSKTKQTMSALLDFVVPELSSDNVNKQMVCLNPEGRMAHQSSVNRLSSLKGTFMSYQAYEDDDILEIDVMPFNILRQDETKEFRPSTPLSMLEISDRFRRQMQASWQEKPIAAWTLLISYLLPLQQELERRSQAGDSSFPLDPTFHLLSSVHLTNWWSLTKVLSNIEEEGEHLELTEDDAAEIKKQWREVEGVTPRSLSASSLSSAARVDDFKSLSWKQVFHRKHPRVTVCTPPYVAKVYMGLKQHVKQLKSFVTIPVNREQKTQYDNQEMKVSLLRNGVLVAYSPRHERLTLDVTREFFYYNTATIPELPYVAQLQVLFSPRYREKPDWIGHTLKLRDEIMDDLKDKIFKGIEEYFLGYSKDDASSDIQLRAFISKVLAGEPYSRTLGSLIFCVSVACKKLNKRFIVSVGNCLALSSEQKQLTTVVPSMYEANGVPVSLHTLNKFDDPEDWFPKSLMRQQEAIQIKVIESKSEILLISPRMLRRKSMKEMADVAPTKKHKLHSFTVESKQGATLQQFQQGLVQDRQRFLPLVTAPAMISAWAKLEDTLKDEKIKTAEYKDEKDIADFKSRAMEMKCDRNFFGFIKQINAALKKDPMIAIALTEEQQQQQPPPPVQWRRLTDTEKQERWVDLTEEEERAVMALYRYTEQEHVFLDGEKLCWQLVRKLYLIYFGGVVDRMAIMTSQFPDQAHMPQPEIYEYCSTLANHHQAATQFASVALIQEATRRKGHVIKAGSSVLIPQVQVQDAKELREYGEQIRVFAHLLGHVADEKMQLQIIADKLKALQKSGYDYFPEGFWQDFASCLITFKLPRLSHHLGEAIPIHEVLSALQPPSAARQAGMYRQGQDRSGSYSTTSSSMSPPAPGFGLGRPDRL